MVLFYGHHRGKDPYTNEEIDTQTREASANAEIQAASFSREASANAEIQAHNHYDGLWDDLRFPMQTFSEAITGQEPEWDVFRGAVFIPYFEENTIQSATFAGQLPHKYKHGTDIFPHVHWTVVTSAGGGDVVWKLEYTYSEIGEIMPTTETLAVTATVETPYKHVITLLGVIDGSNIDTVSSMFICRFYRDGTDPNDDFDNPAGVLEVDFHFQQDELGSVQPLSKY